MLVAVAGSIPPLALAPPSRSVRRAIPLGGGGKVGAHDRGARGPLWRNAVSAVQPTWVMQLHALEHDDGRHMIHLTKECLGGATEGVLSIERVRLHWSG